MSVHIQIMDRGRRLDPALRDCLMGPVLAAVSVLEARAPELDADFLIVPTDIYDGPRWYMSGKALGPGFAHIEINPDHTRFVSDWAGQGAAVALHELHHCLRWQYLSEGWNLGEVVVLEGLAMLAERAGGLQVMDYGAAPSTPVLEALCRRAWRARNQAESAQTAWFRSCSSEDGDHDVPVNYHIGLHMMERAVRQLGVDAFQAARLPAATLLAAGRV